MSATEETPKRVRLTVPKDLEGPVGEDRQPVSAVKWVARDEVQANNWNPNHVAPPELRLLKISLLSDGWTQPIVCREATDGTNTWLEIVDGYHRWLCSEDKRIAAMTGGNVPVVVLSGRELEDLMMSTVRHNRARGTHQVLKMADIAFSMLEANVPDERILQLLQMEPDELDRLKDRGSMVKRGASDGFGAGWTPA